MKQSPDKPVDDLLAVRLDLHALPRIVPHWKITRWNDIPGGWTVVSRHGDYVGLVEEDEPHCESRKIPAPNGPFR